MLQNGRAGNSKFVSAGLATIVELFGFWSGIVSLHAALAGSKSLLASLEKSCN
jgi:hypothetical protein